MWLIPALSPAKNESLVRWPPQGYHFDESAYDQGPDEEGGYKRDADVLRRLYPEIAHWKDISCVHAWYNYGESTSYAATDIYNIRDKYFVAFLYAKQELGAIYDHGGLDEFDSAWKALNK